MVSKDRRQFFIDTAIVIVSFVLSMVFLDYDIELAGASFLLFTICVLFYFIGTWLWTKFNGAKGRDAWRNWEYTVIAFLFGVFFLFGAIETYPSILPTVIFAELSVFTFLFSFLSKSYQLDYNQLLDIKGGKDLGKLSLWFLFAAYTIALIVLTIYEYEPLVNLMALAYFTVLIVLGVRWTFRQVRLSMRLQAEQSQIELQQLQSQVNPHFFFNMLNNLYALVEIDPVKAQALILKLSDLMRYSIYEGQKELVPISEEVSYLQNYISLHEMRYHKVIDIKVDVDIKISSVMVMPLMFIILLENAFKHGIERLREGAYVHMSLSCDSSYLVFSVENNYEAQDTNHPGGIGLSNLRRRLELFYPERHKLEIEQHDDIYKVRLSLSLA